MKKSVVTIFGLLLLASSSMTFTSCKDYDEDDFNELRTELENQNKTLTQLIEAQKNALTAEIEALKKTLSEIKQCTCDPADVDKKIEDAIKDYMTKHPYLSEQDIRNIIEQETKIFVTAEQLDKAIKTLETAVADLEKKHDNDIKDVLSKIATANNAAAEAKAIAEEAKNLAQEAKSLAQEALTKAQEALDKAQEALDKAAAGGSTTELETKVEEAQQQVTENKTKIENITIVVNNLEATITTLETTVQGLSQNVSQALSDASAASAKADVNAVEIQKLWNALNGIAGGGSGTVDLSNYYNKQEIDNLMNRLATKDELTTKATETLNLAKSYVDGLMAQVYTKTEVDAKVSELSTAIEALEGRVLTLETNLGTVETNVTTLQEKVTTIENQIKAVLGMLNKLVSGITVQGTTNNVFGSVRLPMNVNTNVLMAFYGSSINGGTFPTTSKANYANLAMSKALTAKEAEMIGGVMDSEKFTSGQMFASKTVGNAGKLYLTVNPSNVDFSGMAVTLSSSQNTDAGLELTPLAKSDDELKFGVTRAASNGFYETEATVTPKAIQTGKVQRVDIDLQGFASIAKNLKNRLQGTEGLDAGQIAEVLYNTVKGDLNAYGASVTHRDEATGTERQVTSQYNVAAAVITPLSYNFGYQFYGRENFYGYEYADALIDKVGEKVGVKLQAILNSVIGSINIPEAPTIQHIDLKKLDPNDPSIAHFEITILNKVNVDGVMYVIKKDPADGQFYLYNADGTKKDGKPITDVTLGIPEQNIDINLDVNTNINAGVEVPGGTGSVVIGGEEGKVTTDPITGTATGTANGTATGTVTINKQDLVTLPVVIDLRTELADFYNGMIDQLGDVNKMIDSISEYLDDINGLLDNIHVNEIVDDTKNDVTSVLHSVLARVNGKAVRFLNSAILKMQPVMFFTTAEKGGTVIHYPTATMNNPSVIKTGNITLVPISYTAEMLNPAYKKHVAVVNVVKGGKSAQKGDADCLNVLRQVNAQYNMNAVLDGGIHKIPVSLPAGYTYQIAYSALDYTGVISTVRTAIRVHQ